jgi:hypothetical protein
MKNAYIDHRIPMDRVGIISRWRFQDLDGPSGGMPSPLLRSIGEPRHTQQAHDAFKRCQ